MAAALQGEAHADWLRQLEVGDMMDCRLPARADVGRAAGWYLVEVTDVAAGEISFRLMFWGADSWGGVTQVDLQPAGSQTLFKYTGPRKRAQHFLQTILPTHQLAAVPLHEHPLQRFLFDFEWQCSECDEQMTPNRSPAYSCLVCKYDLCVDCFVDQGGIDTHPLPCAAPIAERIQLKSYSRLEFVDDLEELECAVCLSAAFAPPNLSCGRS